MVDKNINVIYDNKIKRVIDYKEGDKQINVLDSRFYKRGENYYPSVTTILEYFPKNQYFISWVKDVGYNSEIIVAKAASEGTQVHNAIEDFVSGKEVNWIDFNGNTKYSLEVWKMILKFSEFWNTYKPKLVAIEYHIFSDKFKYAGTIDLVIELEGKLWLIDIKTSNSLHTVYNLQLSAYAIAWNETHDKNIEETGILWLKASTRGPRKDKIQGKGWELKYISNIDKNFETFQHVHEIFKIENPEFKPHTEILPISIKLV